MLFYEFFSAVLCTVMSMLDLLDNLSLFSIPKKKKTKK